MQPIVRDEHGECRFRQNAVVRWLVEGEAGRAADLNRIAAREFPAADLEQFLQLIGTSVGAYRGADGVRRYSARLAVAAMETAAAENGWKP